MTEMTDKQLETAIRNRAEAEASLACEGLYLSKEQTALFDRFELEQLSHEERRRRLTERWVHVLAKSPAAE